MFPKDGLSTLRLSRSFFEASRDGGASSGDGNNQSSENDQAQTQVTFDSWLDSQPEDVKTKVRKLYEDSVTELRNSVKATRMERDEFSKQLRDASKKIKEGSEERQQLEELANKYDEATKRADFMESAIGEGCLNARVAYTYAKSEGLFDKNGEPEWSKIREAVPELFGEKKKLPRKKVAGTGTGSEAPRSTSMSDWIRQQAGVRTIQD